MMTNSDTSTGARTPYMGHYEGWRKTRLAKIEAIFGRDFFRGKTVLELGCGYGHIGKHFREVFGAQVTFAEVRYKHLKPIAQNNPGAEVILLDQEYDWSLDRQFDAIIHFGVSYHLINWRQDLRCAMEHTKLLIFETEVADSLDPKFVRRFADDERIDQAANEFSVATRVSAAHIEAEIVRNGGTFERYDDPALNHLGHIYDWVATGKADAIPEDEYERSSEVAQRRFWVIRR